MNSIVKIKISINKNDYKYKNICKYVINNYK